MSQRFRFVQGELKHSVVCISALAELREERPFNALDFGDQLLARSGAGGNKGVDVSGTLALVRLRSHNQYSMY